MKQFVLLLILAATVTAFSLPTPPLYSYHSSCGNGVVEIGEQCELPMQPVSPYCPMSAKFCNDRCQCQTFCGNGVVEAGEECDGGPHCNPVTCTANFYFYVYPFFRLEKFEKSNFS
ncbi:MAG TPA: hypothetical protein VJC39_02130 [Candidatus Nanoarchaeia archaeon]|nr:hypothetical protein [Candidatus Nanoarchaeia archaeon]